MIFVKIGSMPEWLKGTDCKSVGLHLRWFKSSSAQKNRLNKNFEGVQLVESTFFIKSK